MRLNGNIKSNGDMGIAAAIDDTGAGYSSFEAIVELKPDYVKLEIQEYNIIKKPGVPLGQEFLLARPSYPIPDC